MSKRRGAGEGSIYRRSDGRWAAVVDLGWSGGKRRRKFLYGKTRREVVDQLATVLKDRNDGIFASDSKTTVEEFLTSWLESAKASLRPSTWRRYDQYARKHIIPGIGRIRLKKLLPQHLHQFYADRLAADLAPQTVLHIHRFVHRMLNQAVRWELLSRNVAELVDPPRVSRYEARTLTIEEARSLLAAVETDRLRSLYVLALTTGLRQGELLGLRWRDIDLDAGVLRVTGALRVGHDGRRELGETKTLRSRRQVHLTRTAIEALLEHRELQEKEAAEAKHWSMWEDNDLVFANAIGRPISVSNLLRRSFYPALIRAGLPRLRFHDLRHTVATLLLSQGTHPKIVSEMLGHTQIGITMDLYSHVTATMHEAASGTLDLLFGSQNGSQMGIPDDKSPDQPSWGWQTIAAVLVVSCSRWGAGRRNRQSRKALAFQ